MIIGEPHSETRSRYVTQVNQRLNEMREHYALYAWHDAAISRGREWAAAWCREHPAEPMTAFQRSLLRSEDR